MSAGILVGMTEGARPTWGAASRAAQAGRALESWGTQCQEAAARATSPQSFEAV